MEAHLLKTNLAHFFTFRFSFPTLNKINMNHLIPGRIVRKKSHSGPYLNLVHQQIFLLLFLVLLLLQLFRFDHQLFPQLRSIYSHQNRAFHTRQISFISPSILFIKTSVAFRKLSIKFI